MMSFIMSSTEQPLLSEDMNITEEHWKLFIEKLKKYSTADNNKTFIENVTNLTTVMPTPVSSCDDYCDSHMRHIFESYRHYHGYITLVVSIYV